MISRTTRRAVAWIGILGIALAQVALTAHACAPGAAASFDLRVAVTAAAGPAQSPGQDRAGLPCGHDVGEAAGPNLCEVHCSDGVISGSSPDLPPVALTALPVTVVPFVASAATPSDALARPAAFAGAPPPALQFCRLLI